MICLVKCQEIWEVTGCELCVSDTEDASETDLAKHDEDDYVELKEQWVENLTSPYVSGPQIQYAPGLGLYERTGDIMPNVWLWLQYQD